MKYTCLRCQHVWFPRSDKIPTICPNEKCHSRNWNSKNYIKRDKYNFKNINIGEEKLYPWSMNPNFNQALRERFNLGNALRSFSSRTGRKFNSYGATKGLLVKRIA